MMLSPWKRLPLNNEGVIMKTYFKLKLIKILFLLSILTLFTHFWSPNNSYSCGGSESQCSATKTACDTNCQTSYDAAVQSCHDNWDLDPCLAWYCLTVDDECRAWYTGTCQLNLSNCLNGNLNAYNSCKAACQTNYDACVIPCVTITATAGSNGSISRRRIRSRCYAGTWWRMFPCRRCARRRGFSRRSSTGGSRYFSRTGRRRSSASRSARLRRESSGSRSWSRSCTARTRCWRS